MTRTDPPSCRPSGLETLGFPIHGGILVGILVPEQVARRKHVRHCQLRPKLRRHVRDPAQCHTASRAKVHAAEDVAHKARTHRATISPDQILVHEEEDY